MIPLILIVTLFMMLTASRQGASDQLLTLIAGLAALALIVQTVVSIIEARSAKPEPEQETEYVPAGTITTEERDARVAEVTGKGRGQEIIDQAYPTPATGAHPHTLHRTWTPTPTQKQRGQQGPMLDDDPEPTGPGTDEAGRATTRPDPERPSPRPIKDAPQA
jgi:hypothetical protein